MKKDTELLFSITEKGCKFDYYKGSGKGGQKRNKTENCVRCRHIPSGAMATSEEGRSKDLNKRRAFKKMSETKEFKIWMKREVSIISGELDKIKNYVKDGYMWK